MAEYSYENRNPRLVFQRAGVEDEKAKAARILAMCAEKPIRRITCAADITPIANPYIEPVKRMTAEMRSKRARISDLLQAGPAPGPELDRALGGKEKARTALAAMKADGEVDREIVVMEAGKDGLHGGLRRVAMWRLL